MRVPQPHERRDQHPVWHRRAHAPHDLADQQAVGEDRYVLTVLLERRHRHHDRNVARKVIDLRPGHLLKQHRGPPPRCARFLDSIAKIRESLTPPPLEEPTPWSRGPAAPASTCLASPVPSSVLHAWPLPTGPPRRGRAPRPRPR